LGRDREAVDHVVPRLEIVPDVFDMGVSVRVVPVDLLAEHVGVDPGLLEVVRDDPAAGVDADRPVRLTSGTEVGHVVEAARLDDAFGQVDSLRRSLVGHLDMGVAAPYGGELAPLALLARVALAHLRRHVPGPHATLLIVVSYWGSGRGRPLSGRAPSRPPRLGRPVIRRPPAAPRRPTGCARRSGG